MSFQRIIFWAVLLSCQVEPLRGENVDLSTVPARRSVQLTIYNSEDITLVRETRFVTFTKGLNPLQFSWANTLIDSSSVELRFLTNAQHLEVLDTTFPHSKPQMLYWNVQSEFAGEAEVQITYFTSGISWSADYQCVADVDEQHMSFEGFVRVINSSGEDYEDAQVRLVVGTINLVEKIAELAQVAVDGVMGMKPQQLREWRKTAAKHAFLTAELDSKKTDLGRDLSEKQIVKDGLSEYFMYTIEGTESIKHGWSKRMRSLAGRQVPFAIEHRFRPVEYGEKLTRMYLVKNDKASSLGSTPLPDGIVRVFRDNGREGLSFLGQQAIKYVPVGDMIEIRLGADPEVHFELRKLRVSRRELWLKLDGTNRLRMLGDDVVQVDEKATLVGWDDHEVYSQRIRNSSGKEIRVEIRRRWPGHVDFRSQLQPSLHDYQTVEFKAAIPAGAEADLVFELVRRQGRNAKQMNVTLQEAEIKP